MASEIKDLSTTTGFGDTNDPVFPWQSDSDITSFGKATPAQIVSEGGGAGAASLLVETGSASKISAITAKASPEGTDEIVLVDNTADPIDNKRATLNQALAGFRRKPGHLFDVGAYADPTPNGRVGFLFDPEDDLWGSVQTIVFGELDADGFRTTWGNAEESGKTSGKGSVLVVSDGTVWASFRTTTTLYRDGAALAVDVELEDSSGLYANLNSQAVVTWFPADAIATAGSENEVAIFDANGKLGGSGITDDDTDVAMSDRKLSRMRAKVSTQSGTTYTLVAADNGTVILFTNAAGCAVTLPNSFAEGFNCMCIQKDADDPVTFAAEAGGSIAPYPASADQTAGQNAVAVLLVESNSGGSAAVWNLGGAVEASA